MVDASECKRSKIIQLMTWIAMVVTLAAFSLLLAGYQLSHNTACRTGLTQRYYDRSDLADQLSRLLCHGRSGLAVGSSQTDWDH